MGYAKIISGGPEGRYVIELDFGEDARAALVERFSKDAAEAQSNLFAAEQELSEKESTLSATGAEYEQAQNLFIDTLTNPQNYTEEQKSATIKAQEEAFEKLSNARKEFFIAKYKKDAISFTLSRIQKQLATFENLTLTEVRFAWCADFTEDAEGLVATIEIPGESNLILVVPGAPVPDVSNVGYLRARELMSPWQAFFNAAILPGWQKFKPTFRHGVISQIDRDANTASVGLVEAKSSVLGLSVNQGALLENVPIEYMECDHDAFDVGDDVVIQFDGQDFASPRVIGFVDTPRQCTEWPDVLVDHYGLRTQTISFGGGISNWVSSIGDRGICGQNTVVVLLESGTTYRAWSETTNDRFASPPSDDGFVISAQLQTLEWGTGVAFTATGGEAPDGGSPARSISLKPEGIVADDRPFSTWNGTSVSYLGDDSLGNPICTSVPVSGKKWDLVPVEGYRFELGYSVPEYKITSILGQPPGIPTVSVTYKGRTREYRVVSSTGTSPTVLRYGPA